MTIHEINSFRQNKCKVTVFFIRLSKTAEDTQNDAESQRMLPKKVSKLLQCILHPRDRENKGMLNEILSRFKLKNLKDFYNVFFFFVISSVILHECDVLINFHILYLSDLIKLVSPATNKVSMRINYSFNYAISKMLNLL